MQQDGREVGEKGTEAEAEGDEEAAAYRLPVTTVHV
jgi:hypothetical protein